MQTISTHPYLHARGGADFAPQRKDRCTLRSLLTLFMYVGVVLFLYPYATGHMSSGLFFLWCGAALTLACGILRCSLTDGDCKARANRSPRP